MLSREAAHVGDVAIGTAFDGVVVGARMDDAEKGEHSLGVVIVLAEDTAVIVVRVCVRGRIEKVYVSEGCCGVGHSGAVGVLDTCRAERVGFGHNLLCLTDGSAGAETEQQQRDRQG